MFTGRVAVCEDELTTVANGLVHVVHDFEEQMDELHRMGCRAGTVVDGRHICHVAVVRLVKIDSIPAGLEVDLSTHPVLAVRVVHVRGLRHR